MLSACLFMLESKYLAPQDTHQLVSLSDRFCAKGKAFQFELQRGKKPAWFSNRLYGKQGVGSVDPFFMTKTLAAQEKLSY